MSCSPGINQLIVSIHAPVQGATTARPVAPYLGGFYPRPRAGGDGEQTLCLTQQLKRFYPRPRAGGDQRGLGQIGRLFVSIHAPVQGATLPADVIVALETLCFYPRPRAGGDLLRSGTTRRQSPCFYPRPRAGGDKRAYKLFRARMVSIHAPVQGATLNVSHSIAPVRFLSTPPCRGRHKAIGLAMASDCFYPRPRAGGDGMECWGDGPPIGVSIHAPVQGATKFTQIV